MATISNISVGLVARTGKFISGFRLAGKSLKTFTVRLAKVRMRQFNKGIRKARRSINAFRKSFFSVTGAAKGFAGVIGLAGAGVSAGLAVLVKKSFSAIDAMGKVGEKLGIATEDLAGLNLAAELTGVPINQLELGLQRMTRRVSEASMGMGEAQGALKELGLDAKQLTTLAPDKAFIKIAGAIAKAEGESNKIRLAFKLFDSEGVNLKRTLALGAEGLKRIRGEAVGFGLALSSVEVAQVTKANDTILRVGKALEGVSNQIAVALAPIITVLGDRFAEFIKQARVGSGDIIEGFRKIALAGAWIVQGFELLKVGWFGVQAVIRKGISLILDYIALMVGNLARLAEFIPGAGEFAAKLGNAETAIFSLSARFEQAGKESGEAFSDAWENVLDKKAVKDVNKFFDKLKTDTAKAGKDMADKLGPMAPGAGAGAGAGKGAAAKTGSFRQVKLSRIAINGTTGQRDNVMLDETKKGNIFLKQIANNTKYAFAIAS